MTKHPDAPVSSTQFDELRKEIRREGARAAFEALLAVCKDPKAPAPARATAATSIFRASGLFERSDNTEDGKLLSEMSPSELNAVIRRHEREMERADAAIKKGEASLAAIDNVLD